MAQPDGLNYKKQMEQNFGTLTTIKEITQNIFKAYPVRVRTQEPMTYFEIGARNIDSNGDIVILPEDRPKESANITAYKAQVLQEGDIIIPFRNKKLCVGLFIGSDIPFVPNPSLLVIRSGSLLVGKYLLICLRQPFIISYLEHLAQNTGNLEIEGVSKLDIPSISTNFKIHIDKLEKIIAIRKQQKRIMKHFRLFEEMLSSQLLGSASAEPYDTRRLQMIRPLLDEIEKQAQYLKRSIQIDKSIAMLDNNYRELVERLK